MIGFIWQLHWVKGYPVLRKALFLGTWGCVCVGGGRVIFPEEINIPISKLSSEDQTLFFFFEGGAKRGIIASTEDPAGTKGKGKGKFSPSSASGQLSLHQHAPSLCQCTPELCWFCSLHMSDCIPSQPSQSQETGPAVHLLLCFYICPIVSASLESRTH